MNLATISILATLVCAAWSAALDSSAGLVLESDSQKDLTIFRRDNLVAWCIVPYDAKHRNPEERAQMLAKLGFVRFAYDYRPENLSEFEAEIEACQRHGISIYAWWFPNKLNDEALRILSLVARYQIQPQLWVGLDDEEVETGMSDSDRVNHVASRLQPIVDAAAERQLTVGLYNHGGWGGRPENIVEVLKHLDAPNVGIVYNLMHGHDDLDRFDEALRILLPHLLAINLNGMNTGGDQTGQKFLQLGQGEHDLAIVRSIAESGFSGQIGIVGHTKDDAEARLLDGLDGLDWLVAQVAGDSPTPRPTPRTPIPPRITPPMFAMSRRMLVGMLLGISIPFILMLGVLRRKKRGRTPSTSASNERARDEA